jgi:hypothetical protein
MPRKAAWRLPALNGAHTAASCHRQAIDFGADSPIYQVEDKLNL